MTPVIAVVLTLAILGLALLTRARNRELWKELSRLRVQLTSVRTAVVAERKERAMAAVRDLTRLPLRMPSQNGEDVLLWNFFERKTSGFYVDVGAHDGVFFSNTYFFEAIGWSGVLVEGVPEFARSAATSRPHSRVVHAAAGKRSGIAKFTVAEGEGSVGALSSATPDRWRIAREGGRTHEVEVPAMTLDEILRDVHGPIDFVSIDVEEGELEVLEGFDLARFGPRVLVIEDNSGRANGRVTAHLAGCGYVERLRVEQNVFYTRRDERREIG